jgi:hypothetical protein
MVEGCLQKKLQNNVSCQGFWLSPYIKSKVKFGFFFRQEDQTNMSARKQELYFQHNDLTLYSDFSVYGFFSFYSFTEYVQFYSDFIETLFLNCLPIPLYLLRL